MKYVITITETFERHLVVEANSVYEAEDKVKQAYYDEKIILDYGDFIGCEIEQKLVDYEDDEWNFEHYPALEDE